MEMRVGLFACFDRLEEIIPNCSLFGVLVTVVSVMGGSSEETLLSCSSGLGSQNDLVPPVCSSSVCDAVLWIKTSRSSWPGIDPSLGLSISITLSVNFVLGQECRRHPGNEHLVA